MARQEFMLEDEETFVAKLHEVIDAGTPVNQIKLYTPHHVHHAEELMQEKPSPLRFFTLAGALTGCLAGFGLCIYTSAYSWPLITGGKPLISIPAFIVIAFELTILFGAIFSFLGFHVLCRLPDFRNIVPDVEYGNNYTIIIESEDQS